MPDCSRGRCTFGVPQVYLPVYLRRTFGVPSAYLCYAFGVPSEFYEARYRHPKWAFRFEFIIIYFSHSDNVSYMFQSGMMDRIFNVLCTTAVRLSSITPNQQNVPLCLLGKGSSLHLCLSLPWQTLVYPATPRQIFDKAQCIRYKSIIGLLLRVNNG